MLACRTRLGLTCQEVADKAMMSREYYIKVREWTEYSFSYNNDENR